MDQRNVILMALIIVISINICNGRALKFKRDVFSFGDCRANCAMNFNRCGSRDFQNICILAKNQCLDGCDIRKRWRLQAALKKTRGATAMLKLKLQSKMHKILSK